MVSLESKTERRHYHIGGKFIPGSWEPHYIHLLFNNQNGSAIHVPVIKPGFCEYLFFTVSYAFEDIDSILIWMRLQATEPRCFHPHVDTLVSKGLINVTLILSITQRTNLYRAGYLFWSSRNVTFTRKQ